jgi:hypothetical protein
MSSISTNTGGHESQRSPFCGLDNAVIARILTSLANPHEVCQTQKALMDALECIHDRKNRREQSTELREVCADVVLKKTFHIDDPYYQLDDLPEHTSKTALLGQFHRFLVKARELQEWTDCEQHKINSCRNDHYSWSHDADAYADAFYDCLEEETDALLDEFSTVINSNCILAFAFCTLELGIEQLLSNKESNMRQSEFLLLQCAEQCLPLDGFSADLRANHGM